MSSFDKVVKGACKPKAAVPKSKYLDTLIAATYSEDGSVHDVCKALAPKFKEPNAIVVFKALLTLHTIIRNGSTDNILAYLSNGDILRLKNVSAPNWEGYNAPENLSNYAAYLDTRIRAFRDLKHDAIRVQSENNRDMRNSAAIEDDWARRKGTPPTDRRKTIAGRKLRIMTVEKGLLRETKVVQKMIDALCECRFYLDNLEDQLNIMALRMLVKDLLILFQACNEGVINVLEHYFEMSKVDASEALRLYRHFCKQTERVVEFLGVAKKLQNLLNVPIPNLKHAPVSLVNSLEEYLNDPHFEQNRIEYKASKGAAEKAVRSGGKSRGVTKKLAEPAPKESTPSTSQPSSSSEPPKPADGSKAMQDFFAAIEEEQTTMFNPRTGSPSTAFFQQQATFNPFAQGTMFGASPFQQPFGVQPQQTGFVMPQQASFPVQSAHNPFGQHLQPQLTAMPFMQPQPTAAPLMPQMTINPFRQNAPNGTNGIQPQATGSPFGPSPTNSSPFGNSPVNQGSSPFQNLGQTSGQQQQIPFNTAGPFNANLQPNMGSPFMLPQQMQQQQSQPPPQPQNPVNSVSVPPRPASAPLKTRSPEPIKLLVAQQTGSKNPFGIPTAPPPPVPKVPTLMELAMNKQQELQRMQQQNGQPGQISSSTSNPSAGSTMSNIASDFAVPSFKNNSPATNTLSPQMTSTTNSSLSTDTLFSSVSTQPTGATTSTFPSISVQPTGGLTSHATGLGTFTGLKTFKPSSSFGASLLESLPPIPGSGPTTPSATSENQGQLGFSPRSTVSSPGPATSTSTTLGGLGGFGTSGSNLTLGNQGQPNGLGSTLGGSGLITQPTGLGILNTQQPLTTGLGSGLGTGLSTSGPGTGFGSNLSTTTSTGTGGVGVGLRPQTTDTQGVANPFRTTMFSSSTSTPGLGGVGGGLSGGFGTNPGLGLEGFTGGLGGLGGTPFGQNPSTQSQLQQQRQGSLI